MVSDKAPVEIRVYGPARHYPALVGFILFETLQTCTLTSHMSIMATFYLKFEAVRSFDLKSRRIKFNLFLIQMPVFASLIAEIATICVAQLPEEMQLYYAALNKDNLVYTVVGSGLQTLASTINVAITSGTSFTVPIVSYLMRRSILLHINSHLDRSSHMKKLHNKLFVTGLTIQVIIPLVTYTPIFAVYYYCIVTHEVLYAHQYFMCLVPAIPSLCDPCVALWFVAPYRKKIKTWLKLEKSSTMVVPREHSSGT